MQAQLAHSHSPLATSDPVFPSVRGEFYKYSSDFSIARPLYCLMKCKSNKSRPLDTIEQIPEEVDLTFIFENGVWVCSPDSVPSARVLGDFVDPTKLNHSAISSPIITKDEFYELRNRKDGTVLAAVCKISNVRGIPVRALAAGTVYSVKTESGKYGMFLVTELTSSSIKIDACHILL